MPLTPSHTLLDGIALLLIALSVGVALTRRLDRAVWLLVGQGVLLVGAALVITIGAPSVHGLATIALTLIVKVIAVPMLLAVVVRRLPLRQETTVVLSPSSAALIAFGLVLLAFHVSQPLAASSLVAGGQAVPAATAMVLLGLFTMIVRKKAVSQVVGLVTMENGVYLAALVATEGLPLAVELAVAADVLLAVVVFAILTERLQQTFASINTDLLRFLRG
jgi:hydrogenase-4 component E